MSTYCIWLLGLISKVISEMVIKLVSILIWEVILWLCNVVNTILYLELTRGKNEIVFFKSAQMLENVLMNSSLCIAIEVCAFTALACSVISNEVKFILWWIIHELRWLFNAALIMCKQCRLSVNYLITHKTS